MFVDAQNEENYDQIDQQDELDENGEIIERSPRDTGGAMNAVPNDAEDSERKKINKNLRKVNGKASIPIKIEPHLKRIYIID